MGLLLGDLLTVENVTATNKIIIDNAILISFYREDRECRNKKSYVICMLLSDCMCEGGSCCTFLGVPVLVDVGIAGITCQLSLHMFPLFAPEPGGPSAAAGCLTHPENDQDKVRMLASDVHLEFTPSNNCMNIWAVRTVPFSSLTRWSF